jgi:hypothetical protein
MSVGWSAFEQLPNIAWRMHDFRLSVLFSWEMGVSASFSYINLSSCIIIFC